MGIAISWAFATKGIPVGSEIEEALDLQGLPNWPRLEAEMANPPPHESEKRGISSYCRESLETHTCSDTVQV